MSPLFLFSWYLKYLDQPLFLRPLKNVVYYVDHRSQRYGVDRPGAEKPEAEVRPGRNPEGIEKPEAFHEAFYQEKSQLPEGGVPPADVRPLNPVQSLLFPLSCGSPKQYE